MTEQHSLTSLSARLGVTRAAALGAISSGRIPAKTANIGARKIYTLSTSSVEKYRAELLTKLRAKIALVTSDPTRRAEMTSSALAAIRDEAAAESDIYTPQRIADRFGIGLEAASYLLGRYAVRVENGFKVDASALAKIERHINETRGSGTITNKGGVFVS